MRCTPVAYYVVVLSFVGRKYILPYLLYNLMNVYSLNLSYFSGFITLSCKAIPYYKTNYPTNHINMVQIPSKMYYINLPTKCSISRNVWFGITDPILILNK